MNVAADNSHAENNQVGLLQLPINLVTKVLENVDEKSVRNVSSSCKSTRQLKHIYKFKQISMTKLVCTVRATDVALRKCYFTKNGLSGKWTGKVLHIPKSDLIEFLHTCAPQQLALNGSDEFSEMDAKWWENISKITLNLSGNVLDKYLPMLKNCSQLDVWYSGQCNVTDIINSMSAVEHFKFVGSQIEITDGALLALGAAIQKGNGLSHLEICTREANQWVSLQAYIDFVKTIKYGPNKDKRTLVNVGSFSVLATKTEIHSALQAIYEGVLSAHYGFNFRHFFENNEKNVELLVVATPDAPKDLVD